MAGGSGPREGCRTAAVPRLNLFRSGANCTCRAGYPRLARKIGRASRPAVSPPYYSVYQAGEKPQQFFRGIPAVCWRFGRVAGARGQAALENLPPAGRDFPLPVVGRRRDGRLFSRFAVFLRVAGVSRRTTRDRPRSNFANRYDANETAKYFFAPRHFVPNRFDRPRADSLSRSVLSTRLAPRCAPANHNVQVTTIWKHDFEGRILHAAFFWVCQFSLCSQRGRRRNRENDGESFDLSRPLTISACSTAALAQAALPLPVRPLPPHGAWAWEICVNRPCRRAVPAQGHFHSPKVV